MEIKLTRGQVQAALLFVAKKDVRFYLTGVNLNSNHLVATDGHTLLLQEVKGIEGVNIILPAEPLEQFVKSKLQELTINVGDKRSGVLSYGAITVMVDYIDHKYPDYRRVIPRIDESKLTELRGSYNSKYIGCIEKAAGYLTGERSSDTDKVRSYGMYSMQDLPKCIAAFRNVAAIAVVMPLYETGKPPTWSPF